MTEEGILPEGAHWYHLIDATGKQYHCAAFTAADAIVQSQLKIPWVIKSVQIMLIGQTYSGIDVRYLPMQ